MLRSMLTMAVATAASCHPHASSSPSAPDAAPLGTATSPPPPPTRPSASTAPTSGAAVTLQIDPPSGTLFHRFRKTNVRVEDLARLVAASPELARIGGDASFFDPGDVQFLTRSKADREDVTFTTMPIVWTPEPGVELLVVTGRGKVGSFVAAWSVSGQELRLASSFVMLSEVAPVALAFRREERTLSWTSCWQCPGETGHVSWREDHHVVIVQD